jgi:phage gpG-like protein
MAGPAVAASLKADFKGFYADLHKLDAATSGAVLVTTVRAGGSLILNASIVKAPKRTRTLARSLHMEVTKLTRHAVELAIGTDLVYAPIHEFGGTIVPKNARLLAIPVGDRTGSPRKYNDLHFVRARSGQMFLMDSEGNIQYSLRAKVTIPARPYMRPAFDEERERAVATMALVLDAQIARQLR